MKYLNDAGDDLSAGYAEKAFDDDFMCADEFGFFAGEFGAALGTGDEVESLVNEFFLSLVLDASEVGNRVRNGRDVSPRFGVIDDLAFSSLLLFASN